jgi:predicted ATP-dependent endonuclease of OLD family
MYLHSFTLKNFRRLKDAHVDLDDKISIFVGANNSGKTSATHAFKLFMSGSSSKFSIHDFSSDCWRIFNQIGRDNKLDLPFPTISLDLWFEVQASDLHRVMDLLPSLKWADTKVGMRIELAPRNPAELLANFRAAVNEAAKRAKPGTNGNAGYHPWPESMKDYLAERLANEYDLLYFVLDPQQFDANFQEIGSYTPLQIERDSKGSGAQILKSLICVDFLSAQRFLSEQSGGRAEDLSNRLSRFYRSNLEKHENDHEAIGVLVTAEESFNKHLETVFADTLDRLDQLGYPGLSNPRLIIKSALKPETIMKSDDTAVHYGLGNPAVGEDSETLPDSYNGLGFKNLIYMVIELIDLHNQWVRMDDVRPPLHIVFIEEPEAHLHAQLQQAFVRKVLDVIKTEGEEAPDYASQFVVTTHSAHILYERGFKHIRYFRRCPDVGIAQASDVLNVSSFYASAEPVDRDFLQKYMKLTHCDLFFADAAVLVEGNVERLLLPQMIAKIAPKLQSAYLSILEVGGAFAYRFKELIEFLGITALVITDIDSVKKKTAGESSVDDDLDEADAEEDDTEASESVESTEIKVAVTNKAKACRVHDAGAFTSNQTLRTWLPKKLLISDVLSATEADCTQEPTNLSRARIRVVFQKAQSASWNGESGSLAGRTLEEAFAFENLEWCQDIKRKHLGLRVVTKTSKPSLEDMGEKLFRKVKLSSFDKTAFALGVLADADEGWVVPTYIEDGLKWLCARLVPDDDSAATSRTTEERVPKTEAASV